MMRKFNITVNGTAYDVAVDEVSVNEANSYAPVAPVAQSAPVAPAPAPVAPVAPAPAPAPAPTATGAGEAVMSPMPGTIVDVKVNVGDKVKSGQVLVVLEAMKMENDIVAPTDATVTSVSVKKGDTVNSNDALVTLA